MAQTASPITLTATETEVFGVGVQEAYQFTDFFGEDWTLFQGMTAGEIINVPVFEKVDALNYPDAWDHLGTATITGHEVQLVDPIKAFVDIMMTQVDIRPDLNIISNTGRALGRAVGYGRTIRVANHMIDHASDASNQTNVDNVDSDSDVVAKRLKNGLQEVAAAFDDAGIPADQRYGLLKPTPFYALRGQAEVISRDYTMGQAHNQNIGGQGSVLEYLNFTIRNAGGLFGIDWTGSDYDHMHLPLSSEVVMATNNSSVLGLFWHKESTVVRHQTGLRSAVDWIPREQVWLAIARLHMGLKVIQDDGVHIMVGYTG